MLLINPAKIEDKSLSKCIMETKSKELTKVEYELVANAEEAIDSHHKHLHKLVIFDVKDFYPFFEETLLKRFLNFADNYIKVFNEDKAVIKHTKFPFLTTSKCGWK